MASSNIVRLDDTTSAFISIDYQQVLVEIQLASGHYINLVLGDTEAKCLAGALAKAADDASKMSFPN